MLEVKLFGAGKASYCDQPIPGFPGQQSFQLFCYLLLNRDHPQNRERIASVFWADHSTRESLKYLRNILWRLRGIFQNAGADLDGYVLVNDDRVSFYPSSAYTLDVEAFETYTANSRDVPAEQLSFDQAGQLEKAIELYTGDLLEGTNEEWCLFDRERLSLLHLNTLTRLAVFHRMHDSFARGLEFAERALALDDTREKIHRELMLLYWLAGEPGLALAQYKRCEQILREKIDVSPTEDTRRLYEQMLHNQFHPAPPALIPPTGAPGDPSEHGETFAEYVIQKIHHLRQVIQETNNELYHLEEALKRANLDRG